MTAQVLKRTHDSAIWQAHEDGRVFVGETVDVSGNLDRVKRMREAEINSATMGHCVASIPLAAIAQWAQPFGLSVSEVVADDALLDRCIKDYGKFKVRGGYL